jgi:3-oxoacyl-[acyl-carrier protein] reductase
MADEIAYATSKGALASITRTLALADSLADREITHNTVNPGPVDTGYATPEAHDIVRRQFPQGRWKHPTIPHA